MVNSAIVPVGFDVHFSVRFFFFFWSLGHFSRYQAPEAIQNNPFSAHDSPPKWCGGSPWPCSQYANDLWVKGRLASSSIKALRLQLHDASLLWRDQRPVYRILGFLVGKFRTSECSPKCKTRVLIVSVRIQFIFPHIVLGTKLHFKYLIFLCF